MAESSQPQVLFEQVGRVGVITLNRPERLNAWSAEMAALVSEYVHQCNADPGVGAVVITGAGRGFCSGAELGRRSGTQPQGSSQGQATERRRDGESIPQLFTRSKPLIAAINGPAVGLGLTMTLSCDVRIASERATFSARFVRIGRTPELASSFLLPQIVGFGNAAELVMTGRIVNAEHAFRIGLLSKVVAHENLMEEALTLGDEIAFNPTQQLQWAKQLLYANVTNSDLRAVELAEGVILGNASQSEAAREAAVAFMEKREPRFHKPAE